MRYIIKNDTLPKYILNQIKIIVTETIEVILTSSI